MQMVGDGSDRLENFLRTKDLALLSPPIEFEKNVQQYNAYYKSFLYDNGCCCFLKGYNNPDLMSGPCRLSITPDGIESVVVNTSIACCGLVVGPTDSKSIPFDKMQDVGLFVDKSYTAFNLKRLDIETSGSEGAEVAAAFLLDPDRALAVIKAARDVAGKRLPPSAGGSVTTKLKAMHALVFTGALTPNEADGLLSSIVANQFDFCGQLQEAYRLSTRGDGDLRLTQQQFEDIKAALVRQLK